VLSTRPGWCGRSSLSTAHYNVDSPDKLHQTPGSDVPRLCLLPFFQSRMARCPSLLSFKSEAAMSDLHAVSLSPVYARTRILPSRDPLPLAASF
jgi:hypothetical protein